VGEATVAVSNVCAIKERFILINKSAKNDKHYK